MIQPKVVGYVRVSTEEQTTGVSLETQEAKIRAWCLLHDGQCVALYRDDGLSGFRGPEARPGLKAALDHVCAMQGTLVVYSLSRLARNTRETIDIGERLDVHAAELVSLSEDINTTTAAGKMVFRLLAVLAEFERDQIAERTRHAMAYKRALSQRISRHLPYGFRLEADGVTLEIDPAEQLVIAAARAYSTAGLSLREIARRLAADGFLSRTGQLFQPTAIKTMTRRAA
jgi:DNA invertase Pin-like site-specific DNA recombinase